MSIIAGEHGERVEIDRPLKVGDIVKVCLPAIDEKEREAIGDRAVESPWAEVVEVLSQDRFLGRIDNHTTHPRYKVNDRVVFVYTARKEAGEVYEAWVPLAE
jgi:hypothetical protein